jgi:hypothetical protein
MAKRKLKDETEKEQAEKTPTETSSGDQSPQLKS